jgi:hypothetical protein
VYRAPEGKQRPLRGRSFWESSPPMGPFESPTTRFGNQPLRPERVVRRPRARLCLLKGCSRRFHPRRAQQRYCSEQCGKAARKWSRWKAQQRYRSTRSGKQKRNGQSQRYRERLRSREAADSEAVEKPARVITKIFFRGELRPARLLRAIRSSAAESLTTLLLTGVPAGAGSRSTAGAALETGADLSRRY